MGLLEGRVVVVAGVGVALGAGIVRRSVAHGAQVAMVARSADRLADIAAACDAAGRAVAFPADLTDADACRRVVDDVVATYGRVDVLVYNAFEQPPFEPLARQSLDTIRQGFEINLFGALTMSQLVLPGMVARGDGAIVLVNSAILRQVRPSFGAYKMAKHALLGFARTLATEVGPSGVRVNSIAPGWIWGDVVEGFLRGDAEARGITYEECLEEVVGTLALRRVPTPDEIADAAVFLASDMARAITGQCLDVNAGEFSH